MDLPTEKGKPQPTNSELLSSAKVVAEAAQASLQHQSDNIDKTRVAGAASDLLDAASHYGKLEEKGLGQYVEKAETYLEQYNSSHSTQSTTTTPATATATAASTTTDSGGEAPSGGGDAVKSEGGGYGDYLKVAEGFFKKN